MNKYSYLFFVIVMCRSLTIGQTNRFESTIAANRFSVFTENLTQMDTSIFKDYTYSALFFHRKEGDNKLAQIPNEQIAFGLHTEGIKRTNKNVTFKGQFILEKSYWKDSRWNLSYQQPLNYFMEDPHYYASSKSGNWNNQDYNLNGGFAIPINNTFQVGVDVNYDVGKMYRTDFDPRPEILKKEIQPRLHFQWEANQSNRLHISGSVIEEDVENNVSYSDNDDNLPFNTDLYIRWYAGYGTILIKENLKFRRENTGIQFNISHLMNKEKWRVFTQVGFRDKTHKTFDNNIFNVETSDNIFNYNTSLFTGISLFEMFSTNKTMQILARASYFEGENFMRSFAGKNFNANQLQLNLHAGQNIQTSGKEGKEYLIGFSYIDSDQNDALSQTGVALQEVSFTPTYAHTFAVNNGGKITPNLSVKYKQNLSAQLTDLQANGRVVTDLNDFSTINKKNFYDQVVIPDYEYAASNQFTVMPALRGQLATKKQAIFLELGYQYKTTTNSSKMNSRSFIHTQIGFLF